MKILLVNDFGYSVGGAEDYFFNLKKGLEQRGHRVTTTSSTSTRRVNGRAFQTDYQILESGHFFNLDSYFNPVNYFQFKKILKKVNPDIVHLNNIFYALSPSVLYALKNYRGIMTLHDYYGVCFRDKTFPDLDICRYPLGRICMKMNCVNKGEYFFGRIKQYIIKNGLKNIKLFISPSEYLKKEFERNGISNIKVMPNPCDANVLCIDPPRAEEDLKPLARVQNDNGKALGKKIILYIGRLAKQKGINYLIDSMPVVINKHPDVVLKIAGTGEMENELKRQVDRLGIQENIEFIGWADPEKRKVLYKECLAVIIPSIWPENDPVVKYESAMYGKPLIASNVGGIPEFVKDGETGFLVPPRDSKALAEKIIYALEHENLVQKMSQRLLEIIPNYSLEKYVAELETIYKGMVAQP